jgi:hypothetical protein
MGEDVSMYGSTALVDLGRFFSFLILYTDGRNPWTGDQHVARPLPTHRTTQTQNKLTQTSMSRVEFEPTTPVFERAKPVHALERAATVIGSISIYHILEFREGRLRETTDTGSEGSNFVEILSLEVPNVRKIG